MTGRLRVVNGSDNQQQQHSMPVTSELELISAVLRSGDLQPVKDMGVTKDSFNGYFKHAEYIFDYEAKYGHVPSHDEARAKFPDELSSLLEIDDPRPPAAQVLREARHRKLAEVGQDFVEYVLRGEDDKAYDLLIKESQNDLRSQGDTADVIWASQVQMRNIGWVWWHRIVQEHLNLIVGDGGVGKGFVMVDLVARRTTGRPLPGDDRQLDPLRVLWVGSEDGIETVVKPRLMVARADLDRVAFLRAGQEMSFPSGTPRLMATVVKHQIDLVIIDGITGYLDPGLKSNNEQDVRRALLSLNPMAQETRSTALASLHVNKMSESAAGHRVLGSVAWRNVAKSVMFAGPVPDDEGQFALAWNKSNFCETPSALGYTISSARATERTGRVRRFADTARLDWTGDVDVAPDDLMPRRKFRERGRPPDERVIAENFLREELADGPVLSEVMQKEAEANGISAKTLRRAKEKSGVVAFKQGSRWYWRLP